MGEPDGLHLGSWSLLSKHGFNDGDRPDEVYDVAEAQGLDWDEVVRRDWHPILIGLVRDFLLPALDQRVEVYEIGGTHNPIRAEAVDGVPVPDDVISGRADEGPCLSPDGVVVPWSVVVDRIRAAHRETPHWLDARGSRAAWFVRSARLG